MSTQSILPKFTPKHFIISVHYVSQFSHSLSPNSSLSQSIISGHSPTVHRPNSSSSHSPFSHSSSPKQFIIHHSYSPNSPFSQFIFQTVHYFSPFSHSSPPNSSFSHSLYRCDSSFSNSPFSHSPFFYNVHLPAVLLDFPAVTLTAVLTPTVHPPNYSHPLPVHTPTVHFPVVHFPHGSFSSSSTLQLILIQLFLRLYILQQLTPIQANIFEHFPQIPDIFARWRSRPALTSGSRRRQDDVIFCFPGPLRAAQDDLEHVFDARYDMVGPFLQVVHVSDPA